MIMSNTTTLPRAHTPHCTNCRYNNYNNHYNNHYNNNNGFNYSQPREIMCANCGGYGHIYRICNQPITSFGIICYWACKETRQLRYVLVQRRDSLSYAEFLRGKYSLENRSYIMQLLSNMTVQERTALETQDFDVLWKAFWQNECPAVPSNTVHANTVHANSPTTINNKRSFVKEYHDSKSMFDRLRQGYYLRSSSTSSETRDAQLDFFSLSTAIQATSCEGDAEWGFPKGRRNINESDYKCAMREFFEETGIHYANVRVGSHAKPFEEVFTGSNKKRYKHVYFLAALSDKADLVTTLVSDMQTREIQKVALLTYDEVQARIRPANVERKELFRRVHALLSSKYFPEPNE